MVEENSCGRCQKSDTGKITHYNNHGVDGLLCQDCIKEIEEYYSLTCSKCGKPAHMRGNLIDFEDKKICTICMDEIRLKEISNQESA